MRHAGKPWTKEFRLLVAMTLVIGKAVNFMAWGKTWKKFFDLCLELQEDPENTFKMKRPSRFSDTKFADHSHDVYDKFRNNFKPLTILLERVKEEGVQGSSDEKKKAANANEIQGKIYNWLFALSLSGVTDAYKVYRKISSVLQKINILPHEKYDCYLSYLNFYSEMVETTSYLSCLCLLVDTEDIVWRGVVEEVCLWPRLHEDVRIALELGTYRDINLGMVRQEEYRTRAGSRTNLQWLEVDVEGVVSKVQARMVALVKFLRQGLSEKVYTSSEVIQIEQSRKLLNLKSHKEGIIEHGAARISGLHYKQFQTAAIFFEPDLDTRVEPDDLRLQWRAFNEVLEGMESQAEESSMDILGKLVDPKAELYPGIQSVLSILVRAAVAMGGLESVCESMVSVVEAHTPAFRAILDQQRLEDEVIVAWNGEDTFHCDPVVKEALETYWGSCKTLSNRDGHFVRRSEHIKSYMVSKTVDSSLKKPVKLSVMMD